MAKKHGGARANAGRKPKAAAESTPSIEEAAPRPPQLLANQWRPGQSGNPAGRPKGARNRFGEQFILDFYEDWQANGKAAIAVVRAERPQDYLKAAVAILPKEVKVTPGDFDDLNEADLDRLIRSLAAAISLEIGAGEGAGGEEEARGAQHAGPLSPLQ